MKLFIIILFMPIVLIYPQDDKSKNPNVELPDFVITGPDVVSIKRAEKIKPNFVSTITTDFILPVHLPEELGLRQLSNPIKEDLNLLDTSKFSNGSISAGAGIYSLPQAELKYAYPFKNGIMNVNVGGLNQRAYIDNSDRYSFFGGAGIEYTLAMNNEVLPGTRFLLNGDYISSSYKLFASNDPGQKRSKNMGNYNLGIKNATGKTFIFDLHFDDNFSSLVEDNFTENLISSSGAGWFQFSDFGIGLRASYKKQFLTNESLGNTDFNYFFIRPTISFEFLNSVKAEIGYSFTNSGGTNFNNIYASFGLRVSKNLVLMGEFAPQAEFITSGTFLRENDYFNSPSFTNLFHKKSNYFDVVVKYEYGKYYQIDAGLGYFKSGNLPYFKDSDLSGQFDVAATDAESFNGYVNVLFHVGPYGVLYGSVDYFRIQDKSNNKIPYYPWLKGNVTYGYEITKRVLAELLLEYYSDRYTDLLNTSKLKSFLDLGLKLTYKIHETFVLKLEMSNLLDRNIYIWKNYKETPFDFMLGFSYLFD